MSAPRNDPGRPPAEPATDQSPASDDRATPRAGATPAAGATGAESAANADDEDEPWRHDPVAPVDEQNPLKSVGRAVADSITGGAEGEAEKPKR